jgi:hypothetical protein
VIRRLKPAQLFDYISDMKINIEESVEKLRKRAAAIRPTIDNKTHQRVALFAQETWASFMTAAEIMEQLHPAMVKAIDAETELAKATDTATRVTANFAFVKSANDYMEIQKAGQVLADGKDKQVFKQVAKLTAGLVAKAGAKLSGYELLEAGVAVVGAAKDAAKVGQAVQLRKKQAQAASDYFTWLEDARLGSFVWCCCAQEYLLDASRRNKIDDQVVIDAAVNRIVAMSRTWHDAK